MKARPLLGDRWLVRFDLGEEVGAGFAAFLQEHRIRCGSVRGIGALRDLELGFLDTAKKAYVRKKFPEEMEILSFQGNVSVKEGKSFLHAHVVASDRQFRTVGGHFFTGVVSGTAEFFVTNFPGVEVNRRARPELGFFDLDL
ncbi:MAG TPA: PPC domain-containing DNA-binding protein [Planctomycetota bacterium]|nr:PPC domain-containing DNA-binding protein [Planctomycetota bacterium]